MAWLPMPVLGTLNGLFRGLVLMQFMSEFRAKQLSSVTLIIILFVYTNLIFDRLDLKLSREALYTGLVWVLLTITFEFVLGYMILKQPFDMMLAEYNISQGNFWSLVIISIFFMPFILLKIKTKARKVSNV